MDNKEILDLINKYIRREKGNIVTPKDKLINSKLDSLGIAIFFMNLCEDFPNILQDREFEEFLSHIDINNIDIQSIIDLCKS